MQAFPAPASRPPTGERCALVTCYLFNILSTPGLSSPVSVAGRLFGTEVPCDLAPLTTRCRVYLRFLG